MKYLLKLFSGLCLIYPALMSAEGGGAGFGELAQDLSKGPISFMSELLYGACYLGAMVCFYKAYQGWKNFRAAPLHCGIGGPILNATLGLLLLLVPMAHYVLESLS